MFRVETLELVFSLEVWSCHRNDILLQLIDIGVGGSLVKPDPKESKKHNGDTYVKLLTTDT